MAHEYHRYSTYKKRQTGAAWGDHQSRAFPQCAITPIDKTNALEAILAQRICGDLLELEIMTNDTDGLSLLEAAQRLDISERTLRRRIKAGEVKAEKRALDGGGAAWRVFIAPDTVPDAPDTGRREVANVADTPETTRMQEMREEITFLRGVIEQQQRSEAELRAALRESLKALPKALNAPARGGHVADTLDTVADIDKELSGGDQQQQTGAAATSIPATDPTPPEATHGEKLAQMQPDETGDQTTNASLKSTDQQGSAADKSTFISRILGRLARRG